MAPGTMSALHLHQVVKSYGGLRPLRLKELEVRAGEILGLGGFDQTTAEVFSNLVTGATLPEEGTVTVFGRSTADIVDSDDWLATVDRFGIISERVVLLDQFTPLQNIAMSLTLEVEPLGDAVRFEAERIAGQAGLSPDQWALPIAGTSAAIRHRVRLARALAGSPAVLLIEHPTAGVDPSEIGALADDVRRAAVARGLAVVVLASEPHYAEWFAPRLLQLQAATGDLTELRKGLLKQIFG
jgi:ABC-type transporter Mla maintaining outer membrane lipid asymmetry ATPase subunit MlaF